MLASLGEARRAAPVETGRQAPAELPPEGRKVALGALIQEASRPFAEVLDARRSSRTLGPVCLGALATLLVRGARVRAWAEGPDGYQITHRPAPSAGARHPFRLLLAAQQVDGLEAGWWWFDPVQCDLTRAEQYLPSPEEAVATVAEVGQLDRAPGAVVFLMAYFERTLSRYPAGGSLVWRDAGVLLGLLHLCATDLTLGSCIIGTCGIVRIDRTPQLVADVGAVAIGRSLTA